MPLFFYQKIPLIEYHRNLSTGFIIEPLKKVFLLITTLLGIVLTLTACSTKREANTKNHKVNIVTSTNIYANIARNIVGKHGEVQAIITLYVVEGNKK